MTKLCTPTTGPDDRKREKVEAFGKKQDYLILRLAYGDLTLKVPAEGADEIGLRDVINDEEVEEVFAGPAQDRSSHADQLVATVQEPRREAQER